jgi:septal ring factor EnvC (AmiA/AmiB activator)
MELLTEILKMAASAIAGGGVMWFFNFRKRVQRQGNDLDGQDFDLVSKTVKQAMADLADLGERIGQLEKEKVAVLNRITDLERENAALKKQNQHLESVLRAYIKEKNPNLAK